LIAPTGRVLAGRFPDRVLFFVIQHDFVAGQVVHPVLVYTEGSGRSRTMVWISLAPAAWRKKWSPGNFRTEKPAVVWALQASRSASVMRRSSTPPQARIGHASGWPGVKV